MTGIRSFSSNERWTPTTNCGVVFPYPISRHTEYRVAICHGFTDHRIEARYGNYQWYAFQAGFTEFVPQEKHREAYKKAFGELNRARQNLINKLNPPSDYPSDASFHSIVLTPALREDIKYHDYDRWLTRLTKEQNLFVTSKEIHPQRIEGPAGSGKTLSLMLRSIFLAKQAKAQQQEFRALFIAHSEATRQAIRISLEAIDSGGEFLDDRNNSMQTIEISTLQQWCATFLGERDISSSQFMDQDACAAKQLRKDLLKEILEKTVTEEMLSFTSPECQNFFKNESTDYQVELLQHEIGVMIKGRASEDLNTYLTLAPLLNCIPLSCENDKRFIFGIYNKYQAMLNELGVFDTDDITLTSLARLDTPIWRRQKLTFGYDAIFIDETHLFNMNELSLFHFLLKNNETLAIIFSIDRSQSHGDRGLTNELVKNYLMPQQTPETSRNSVIFRSSPQITAVAESITQSGALLFTSFENPLHDVECVISPEDEKYSREVLYIEQDNDVIMCQTAIRHALADIDSLKQPEKNFLFVATTSELLELLKKELFAQKRNYSELLVRGDLKTIRDSPKNHFIIALPEYVGGLEFIGVYILGIDEGRFPPVRNKAQTESKHFLTYKAYNQLYVAVTRARLVLELFYAQERGVSPLLTHALSNCTITQITLQ